MSKKFYTPDEVAKEVLKKATELYKNSDLYKSNSAHEIETGPEASNDEGECPDSLEDQGIVTESEKKAKGKSSKPAHEEGMSEDEEVDHDTEENEADEEDTDKIEADEEPEAKELDTAIEDAEEEVEEDAEEEVEEDTEEKDNKKKKPFGKSEELSKTSKFDQKLSQKGKEARRKNPKYSRGKADPEKGVHEPSGGSGYKGKDKQGNAVSGNSYRGQRSRIGAGAYAGKKGVSRLVGKLTDKSKQSFEDAKSRSKENIEYNKEKKPDLPKSEERCKDIKINLKKKPFEKSERSTLKNFLANRKLKKSSK